jgi:hypothetical protein
MGTPIVGQHVLFQLPCYHRDACRLVVAKVDAVHSGTCISLSTLHPEQAFTSVVLGKEPGNWAELPEDAVKVNLRASLLKVIGDHGEATKQIADLQGKLDAIEKAAQLAKPAPETAPHPA